MEVQNVKIRVCVKPEYLTIYKTALKDSSYTTKKCSSFYVLRCKFVFICYMSGCINITGIKHISSIPFAIEVLGFMLELKPDYSTNCVIDNITASLKNPTHKIVLLSQISSSLKNDENIIQIKYNRERFPCMFIKTIYGTIIWSPYNKFSCVGVKKEENLVQLHNIILRIQTL